MIRLVLILLLGLAGMAQAQTVEVRSGEHADFTRLVLYLPPGVDGTLDDTNDPVLRLTRSGTSFDIQGVFARIPRTRLAGLTPLPGQGALRLDLACDCPVSLLRDGNNLLILDIRDGPARDPVPPNRPILSFGTTLVSNNIPLSVVADPPSNSPEPRPPLRAPAPLVFPTDVAAAEIETARRTRVADAERALLQQIARAATQGLLDPVQLSPQPVPTHPSASSQRESRPPERPPGAARQITAETSVDTALRAQAERPRLTADGNECLPDTFFDVASWAATQPFGTQLGVLRSAAYGEAGRADDAALLALARFYVHFGFGVEATSVLSHIEDGGRDAAVLRDMAEILERTMAPHPSVLDNQADCDGSVALWSILASPAPLRHAGPDGAAVLRALSALPGPLRAYIGPMLSERLLVSMEDDLAAQVLRHAAAPPSATIEKTPQAANHAMAQARVQLARGETEVATGHLEAVAAAATEATPEALSALLDQDLATGAPIEPARIDEAASYARQLRGTPLATSLKSQEILARATNADYQSAFAILERDGADIPDGARGSLVSQIAMRLASDPEDTRFLDIALAQMMPRANALSPEAADALANRLLTLGFPDESRPFLETQSGEVETPRRRLLRAHAALAQGLPTRAQAELIGLDGTEADALRAEAQALLLRDGPLPTLHTADATAGGQPPPAPNALLADLTRQLSDAPDVTPLPPRPDGRLPEGTLAQNRSLLETSTSARETLQRLLEGVTLDP